MSILVAVTGWDPTPWLTRLRELLPDQALVTPEAPGDLAAVRYALCWKPQPGALEGLPNLRAIFSLGAGVDHVIAYPSLPDVPLVRVVDPDLTARMSEWIVMHALMHLRQVKRYERQQAQRIWGDDDEQRAAHSVRVGILGLGELGLDSARKLRTMGFVVAGWSRSPKTIAGLTTHHGPDGLDALLAGADILVSLLPLTPDTRGFLNAALFAKLARGGPLGGPVLINAGRGGLQVETDIAAALDAGVLAGASLDVFEEEPLPATSPLWGYPNVFITPHNAAMSTPNAVARYIAGQIEACERGEALRNVVDRKRGY